MKKSPAPRVASVPLDFVMTCVFDMYRELATRERTVEAQIRAAPRREARKARETVQ